MSAAGATDKGKNNVSIPAAFLPKKKGASAAGLMTGAHCFVEEGHISAGVS